MCFKKRENMTDILNSTTTNHLQYEGSVLWIVINVLLILLITIGNVLTICAILLCRKLYTVVANQFIFSLAVSDLLVGISLPYHMLFYMTETIGQDHITCLLRFVLFVFALSTSIFNLLLIATDRYMAIVYPLHHLRYMTRKLSFSMIVLAWSWSLTLSLILFKWNDWDENIECNIITVVPAGYMHFIITPLFAIVWIILLLLYMRIYREAAVQSKRINSKMAQTVQVMMTILGCFSLCWLPFFVETTYARVIQEKKTSQFYEISFTLAITNSGLNPLIYAWKNTNFRRTFVCLLKCAKPDYILNSNQFITNHIPNGSKKNQEDIISVSDYKRKDSSLIVKKEGETIVQMQTNDTYL